MNETIEMDLDVDIQDKLIEFYIKANFSDASLEHFEMYRDQYDILTAAGHAVLNEAIVDSLKMMIAHSDAVFGKEESSDE
jgi:hypothetical protein